MPNPSSERTSSPRYYYYRLFPEDIGSHLLSLVSRTRKTLRRQAIPWSSALCMALTLAYRPSPFLMLYLVQQVDLRLEQFGFVLSQATNARKRYEQSLIIDGDITFSSSYIRSVFVFFDGDGCPHTFLVHKIARG